MSDHNIESHIKVYWNVFFALLTFTVLTVAVSYYDFGSVFWTLFVGLAIACFKGYLVAAYFMHLNDEKSFIYLTLCITVAFFLVLFFMPILWHNDTLKSPNYVPIQNGEIYKEIDEHSNHHGDHH